MADRKLLNLLDLSFVLMETRQTPMHVAGLQTFMLPAGAPRDYPRKVYEYLRSFPVTAAPFNYRLRGVGSGRLRPTFEVAEKIDLDYHLRHSALPYPGGERELGILVSRLHSNPMDLDRPLWEIHLIEGLQGGRFALYCKLHHSLADGVSGVGLLNFSTDPARQRDTADLGRGPAAQRAHAEDSGPVRRLQHAAGGLREPGQGIAEPGAGPRGHGQGRVRREAASRTSRRWRKRPARSSTSTSPRSAVSPRRRPASNA